MTLRRSVTRVATILAVLAGLVALGVMNRTDALREQSHYCHMVGAGYWPDFHHSYKQECKPWTDAKAQHPITVAP